MSFMRTGLDQRDPQLDRPRADRAGWQDLDVRAVDTVRVLAADAVQKAGNGHPGTAMSLAPLAYLLFQNVLVHDPADDQWLGRDRFVLSAGHSSLTLYIQLYLSGYGLEIEDLQALRTWGQRRHRALRRVRRLPDPVPRVRPHGRCRRRGRAPQPARRRARRTSGRPPRDVRPH
jgi:transketolase-like protein